MAGRYGSEIVRVFLQYRCKDRFGKPVCTFRNKRCDQQFAGYSGRLCLSQCDRTRYIRIWFGRAQVAKINTEMNDAMVTHAFIDQYDKIWFHENEKALIYYDPLNHTAKRFPFTMFGKITTLYSEDAGERGLFSCLRQERPGCSTGNMRRWFILISWNNFLMIGQISSFIIWCWIMTGYCGFPLPMKGCIAWISPRSNSICFRCLRNQPGRKIIRQG